MVYSSFFRASLISLINDSFWTAFAKTGGEMAISIAVDCGIAVIECLNLLGLTASQWPGPSGYTKRKLYKAIDSMDNSLL